MILSNSECYCSDATIETQRVSDLECPVECDGNPCGGEGTYSIYAVGEPKRKHLISRDTFHPRSVDLQCPEFFL